MPRLRRFLASALAGSALAGTAMPAASRERPAERPNILVIVADDLGWSDLGAFGGEIDTPNLDRLALGGLRLTGFHTAPTCSPTRAMLLSGTDNHRAGLGSMAESMAVNQKGRPGYEGYLRHDVAALPERLRAAGYRTLMAGKWHLGLAPEQDPHARGFEQSFALLQGAANHFGTDAATTVTYTENGQRVTSLPARFYSTDFFSSRLVEQLQTSRAGEGGKRPFFAYLAFTAPHWPLQAPAADIAKYRGRYDEGFDVLRQRRLARQQQLGLIAPGTNAHEPRLAKGWNALSPDQRRRAARDMEVYAAMVDRLDEGVGQVLDELRRTGELDNTLVLFLSDNGAEALDAETSGLDLLRPRIAAADNSLANRGAANSYVTYGEGWAQAATAPSWLVKGYATEGGTRVVSFVNWNGLARPGSIGRAFLTVADVAPTLLDIARVPYAGMRFAGRAVQPVTGRSWLPWLTGRAESVYPPEQAVGTELFGSRAIRQGEWKITDPGDGRWRLFHLASDPGETENLAEREPEQLRRLVEAWDGYAAGNGVVLPDEVRYRP